MIVCWSSKGGSGTTVVAAALALLSSGTHPAWLVDLAGDVPAALGLPEPSSPGVSDWLASPTADAAALRRLAVPARSAMEIIPVGDEHALPTAAHPRWPALAADLGTTDRQVVVDAGVGDPPVPLLQHAHAALLITRSCYMSLRRAQASDVTPTGVVLVLEPGRSLSARDVEAAVGAPVLATVPYDPTIFRAVDAGLLASDVPHQLRRNLRRLA